MAKPHRIIPPLAAKDIARFRDKVRVGHPDECWPFTGHPGATGYGLFSMAIGRRGDHMFVASRVAYQIAFGTIADGMSVLHRCDRPGCCNPAHLFLGTYLDNSRDKIAKGRARHIRGEQVALAKLTAEKVLAIRSRAKPARRTPFQAQLAKEFGVNQTLISAILRRKIWAHV